MPKKKIQGIDRPYTFGEFQRVIEQIAKEEKVDGFDMLDYFSYQNKDEEIKHPFFGVATETIFGSNEGIYTDIVFWEDGVRKRFATAKTLCSTDENFVKMSVFGAKLALIARKYIAEHEDQFVWSGFNVGYTEGENDICCYWCGNINNARIKAEEIKKSHGNPFIRDNATREYVI